MNMEDMTMHEKLAYLEGYTKGLSWCVQEAIRINSEIRKEGGEHDFKKYC